MNADFLKDWAKENKITEKTIEGFWNCYRNWKNEEKDDYHDLFSGKIDDDFLSVEPKTIQLTHIFDYIDLVYCTLDIIFMDKCIGKYRMDFKLDGEVFDDFLTFEDKCIIRSFIAEKKSILKVVKKSLSEGLDSDTISKITGFDLRYINIINSKTKKT